MEQCAEVIDLTDSFTYCRAPLNLSCSVIDLDDSSDTVLVTSVAPASGPVVIDCESDLPVTVSKKSIPAKTKRQSRNSKKSTSTSTNTERERSPHSKYCPICHETLGTNPLASTKCGHVYCIQCIEKALKRNKKCPTCRTSLRGAKPFHPLFL